MENKKKVFTGVVTMLVILFGLLRIAIFTGYHYNRNITRINIQQCLHREGNIQ